MSSMSSCLPLQYELCYTGVLDMLYLSGIPLRQKDRKGLEHLVMGGGPCACNPEPIADFFDLFSWERARRSIWRCWIS